MKVYMRCVQNGKTFYSQHEGMSFETLRSLLADLGGTDIQQVAESEYNEQVSR